MSIDVEALATAMWDSGFPLPADMNDEQLVEFVGKAVAEYARLAEPSDGPCVICGADAMRIWKDGVTSIVHTVEPRDHPARLVPAEDEGRLREAAAAFIAHLDSAPRLGWTDNDPAMLAWAATEYRLQEGIRAALAATPEPR